ncbi:hypothetical protein BB560_000541 [Smittium megazygosporum]|uniref:RCC1-like domain-containing protein n=1 Tax=Smittium megazygosporum TaxID=133381 RepID=A0A2T9ZK61_9FUNG|nr:hypothetical protein BB560_000541 [Smittium megazygosporum]
MMYEQQLCALNKSRKRVCEDQLHYSNQSISTFNSFRSVKRIKLLVYDSRTTEINGKCQNMTKKQLVFDVLSSQIIQVGTDKSSPEITTSRKRKNENSLHGQWRQKIKLSIPNYDFSSRYENTSIMTVGNGDCGQLGQGRGIAYTEIPQNVEGSNHMGIIDISTIDKRPTALSKDGSVYLWGYDKNKVFLPDEKNFAPVKLKKNTDRFIRIESCKSLLVALSIQGIVYSMGDFEAQDKEEGRAWSQASHKLFKKVRGLEHEFIIDIATGRNHVVALSKTGFVYCWGSGEEYQLGRLLASSKTKDTLKPRKLQLKGIVSIGAGPSCSYAINRKGDVYAWGDNRNGQCGNSGSSHCSFAKSPRRIKELKGIKIRKIKANSSYSVALCQDGSLYQIGGYDRCKVYIGKASGSITRPKINPNSFFWNKKLCMNCSNITNMYCFKIPIQNKVVDFDIKDENNFAVCEAGRLFEWGYYNEIIHTDETSICCSPVYVKEVEFERKGKISKVSTGFDHLVLLLEEPKAPS